jgi:hypothetical protein
MSSQPSLYMCHFKTLHFPLHASSIFLTDFYQNQSLNNGHGYHFLVPSIHEKHIWNVYILSGNLSGSYLDPHHLLLVLPRRRWIVSWSPLFFTDVEGSRAQDIDVGSK